LLLSSPPPGLWCLEKRRFRRSKYELENLAPLMGTDSADGDYEPPKEQRGRIAVVEDGTVVDDAV
jgi:hypothetical protein